MGFFYAKVTTIQWTRGLHGEQIVKAVHKKLQLNSGQEKIATVIRMAKKNMPLSDIAECTDLSTDEVQKILNTIAK